MVLSTALFTFSEGYLASWERKVNCSLRIYSQTAKTVNNILLDVVYSQIYRQKVNINNPSLKENLIYLSVKFVLLWRNALQVRAVWRDIFITITYCENANTLHEWYLVSLLLSRQKHELIDF